MTFIEGIGDEVTAFFVIVIVVVLATLVTFIGSGPHLYSPVHTRAVHIAVLSSRETPEETSTLQPPEPHPPNTSNHGSRLAYEALTVESPRDSPADQNDPSEDVSDETEEQSSSDETRTRENDAPESETTPTAPSEPETSQNAAEEDMPQGGIRIRLKYLDDTERTVRSSPVTKIGDFKRDHFSEDLANDRVVRLIFCGHLLRDASTLGSCRIVDNSVVHVQVLRGLRSPERGSAGPQNAAELLDLSHLLWPLISVALGVCWMLYLKYPEFFSALSLSVLFVFTAGLFVFYTHVHQ